MASDTQSPGLAAAQPIARDEETLARVVHDLGAALRSTRDRAQKWLAWQQLHDNGDNVAPYTLAALATLEAAFAQNENDGDLIHHLAIAYHALAWDLELHEDSGASAAWEKALFYWRRLQACGEFWQDLCARGEKLGTEFDRSAVEELRRNLLTYLLEIHVNFIRHYYDMQQPEQAARHIELIRRARIPPAARKQLEALAYPSLTSGAPQMIAEGRFAAALTILDSFLSLFPTCVPALQTYLEAGKQWLDQMIPDSQWQDILDIDERLAPHWDALQTSSSSPAYPLARAALDDLAETLGRKHWARTRSLSEQRAQAGDMPQALAGAEYDALGRVISWLGRLGDRITGYSSAPFILVNALLHRAVFIANVGLRQQAPAEAHELLDIALKDCEEAVRLVPDEPYPREVATQILQSKADYHP